MKKPIYLLLCLATFTLQPAVAQSSTDISKAKLIDARPSLTKFDLDFPGGTPKELVAAIQKALGRPLNAVIPAEFADQKIVPPFVVSQVTTQSLFFALMKIGVKREKEPGYPGASRPVANFAFKSEQPITDDSVWSFEIYDINQSPWRHLETKFYLLTPFLERGLSVDDITTAVQVAWKMAGDPDVPQLSYHKETKLLIAVGVPEKLNTIDQVLNALNTPKSKATEAAGETSKTSAAPKSGP